jgi:hypothetical protein
MQEQPTKRHEAVLLHSSGCFIAMRLQNQGVILVK